MPLELEERAREALIHGPERMLMDGAARTVIDNIAKRIADKPDGRIRSFQADGTLREQTFAETWRRSGEIAAGLQSLGVGSGGFAVLMARDLLDFVPCFWGSLRAGATPVPFGSVAHSATGEELKHLARRLDQAAIVVDARTPDSDRLADALPGAPVLNLADFAGERAGTPAPAEEPELICLLPTSGSTGNPKLVMLGRGAILHRFFSRNYSQGSMTANILNVLPFEGVTGMRAAFPTYASVTQLHPRIVTARPLAMFEAIERFAIGPFQLTNSLAARLVEDATGSDRKFDLGTVTMAGLGGEAVTRAVSVRFDALLRRHGAVGVLRAGYGSTETSSLLVGADPCVAPADEAGAPILGGCAAGISLRIVGDDGAVLGEGEVGHVEAYAPKTMFSGYWKEPELTRASMTADGWYKTGDLGAIHPEGFAFRGRAKQTLVVGGRKFSLDDIDACIQSESDIARQTVSFVVRHGSDATDRLGVAVAVLDGEDLDARVSEEIGRALTRRYGFAPAVVMAVRTGDWPLTGTGKVDRKALAERAAKAGGPAHTEAPAASEAVDEEALAALWREALAIEGAFGRNENFFDRGGDSLRSAALLIAVEKRFNRRIALRAFFDEPTFDNLARLAEGASAASADEETGAWPLTAAIRRRILPYIEGWDGERVTEDRMMFAANREGSRPPLVCVVNAEYEFSGLAEALGPDQPVYAFRSLYYVRDADEDLVQALALGYVKDLEQVCPEGPLFLLAHCQGCDVAAAMAQHLLRRGRHIPLLVLIEWMMEPVIYPGDVLLVYAHDSGFNPRSRDPFFSEAGWRRMFGRYAVVEVEASHDVFLDDTPGLARLVARTCAEALQRSRPFTPLDQCAFALAIARAPARARPGAPLRVEIEVTNVGKGPIGGVHGKLHPGGVWTRGGSPRGARFVAAAPAPEIAPGGVWATSLDVLAPGEEGTFGLALDLLEERGHSLTGLGAVETGVRLKVRSAPTRMRKMLGLRSRG